MAKIIKIDNDNNQVIVGMDDKSTIEVAKSDFNFEINEMMNIDVHKHNDSYVFSPQVSENADSQAPAPAGTVYVKKIPYGLLCLFLGHLGIHEFYAGNPKNGVIMIVITIILSAISHLSLALSIITLAYFITILVVAIKAFCRESNAEGKIPVKKSLF